MNISKLFEIQRKLDEHIEREHPRKSGEDRLGKKLLALQVELGELANELPEVFKFWSKKKNNRERALKEYVDCWHFLLSIGLDLNIKKSDELIKKPEFDLDIDELFMGLYYNIAVLFSQRKNLYKFARKNGKTPFVVDAFIIYGRIFSIIVCLGEKLGFTWEEIEQAYMEKNKVNHERQESGY